MDELFPIEETRMDSPKIAWKRKHNVHTYHSNLFDSDCPWVACFGLISEIDNPELIGEGKTEEEAMRDLAYIWRWNGIKCWNEEEP